jgi:hypothetical protein
MQTVSSIDGKLRESSVLRKKGWLGSSLFALKKELLRLDPAASPRISNLIWHPLWHPLNEAYHDNDPNLTAN